MEIKIGKHIITTDDWHHDVHGANVLAVDGIPTDVDHFVLRDGDRARVGGDLKRLILALDTVEFTEADYAEIAEFRSRTPEANVIAGIQHLSLESVQGVRVASLMQPGDATPPMVQSIDDRIRELIEGGAS